MGKVREIRGNKSQSITEISVWRWNKHVKGVGEIFFLNPPLTFFGADNLTLSRSQHSRKWSCVI